MTETLISTLSLLYDLQKERGQALLPAFCRPETPPDTFQETLRVLEKNDMFQTLLPARFKEALRLRQDPSFLSSMPPPSLFEWYTIHLEQPVHQTAIALLTDNPRFTPAQTSALVHFIAALRELSALRDDGVMVYAKAEITPFDNKRLTNDATGYLARERLYLGLADNTLKQMIDRERINHKSVLGETDHVVRAIKGGRAKELLAGMPLLDWLSCMNEEISALHQALTQTIAALAQQGQELALLAPYEKALDSDIEHRLPSLRSMPLFQGLPEATLRNLLKGARLIDAPKGHVFITQGQAVSRFFIVLDGWVNTYKTSAEGQESVLQLVSKREALLDTDFLHASLAAASAKAVTRASLLALSLPVLRDHASRSRELAQNLLVATTMRLQGLVTQFEQLTLKTAQERVGWFLANLYLETGLEGAPLKLPFDKALIATYLNIKPETFSRILNNFRKEGFTIEKDQITMPHAHALCRFCDPEMSQRCCRAEATNCQPIQIAKKAWEVFQ
ncbi:MAG: Crp/Fnr family transcriptional regulator [Alphaproteobacteria bacterium]|nr:Crp/Fnr family transcriptional regulator [Alphaproteobacteria bacterium]